MPNEHESRQRSFKLGDCSHALLTSVILTALAYHVPKAIRLIVLTP
jgi:hypothetical protein